MRIIEYFLASFLGFVALEAIVIIILNLQFAKVAVKSYAVLPNFTLILSPDSKAGTPENYKKTSSYFLLSNYHSTANCIQSLPQIREQDSALNILYKKHGILNELRAYIFVDF